MCGKGLILNGEGNRNSLRNRLESSHLFWDYWLVVSCCPAALQKCNVFQQYIWKCISQQEIDSVLRDSGHHRSKV